MHPKRFCALVFAALAAGCAGRSPAPEGPPNILFIVSDDQRPDAIGAMGNPRIRTPHLDALVRSGTAFTRAVAPNPVCVTSRAEILTGTSAFTNGVFPRFSRDLNPRLALLPDVLRRGGYRTWYVGKWHTQGTPVTRGYDETRGLYVGGYRPRPAQFDAKGRTITGYAGWVFADDEGNRYPERGIGLTPGISEKFADAAIEFLKRDSDRPFFLHVNFTAPHDPLLVAAGYEKAYDPKSMPLPENYVAAHPFDHGYAAGRDEKLLPVPRTPEMILYELANYYAVIEHMDAQIGRILAAVGRVNTVVVFTSDHGLAIGSHGLMGKQNMYEHTVGVPLIFSGPGIPRGRRTGAQVYLRDLYPTFCELGGIAVPKTVTGKSFLPVVRGDSEAGRTHVFGYFTSVQRMVRGDRWKYIRYPEAKQEQLFDLANDPFELKNELSNPRHAGVLADLRERLDAWQRDMGDPILNQ